MSHSYLMYKSRTSTQCYSGSTRNRTYRWTLSGKLFVFPHPTSRRGGPSASQASIILATLSVRWLCSKKLFTDVQNNEDRAHNQNYVQVASKWIELHFGSRCPFMILKLTYKA